MRKGILRLPPTSIAHPIAFHLVEERIACVRHGHRQLHLIKAIQGGNSVAILIIIIIITTRGKNLSGQWRGQEYNDNDEHKNE